MTKAKGISKLDMEKYKNESGSYVPPFEKPLHFDLGVGGGSKWNMQLFVRLAQECLRSVNGENPRFKISDRVRQPQLERLMNEKYARCWGLYSKTLPRSGETEEDRRSRVKNQLNRTDASKRKYATRTYKLKQRSSTIDEQMKRKESLAAMQFAKRLVEKLGIDGMSSDEEILDDEGTVKGYRTSKLKWRHSSVTHVLHKVDDIKRQLKDSRGAIAASRYEGVVSTRNPVRHLPVEYYDREWLEEATKRGLSVVGGRTHRQGETSIILENWERMMG
jgi:hypothetical protein